MSEGFDIPAPLPLEEQSGQTYPSLVRLMQRLLAEDGCPWDREQDFASLRQYVLEEACEVIDAIDDGDRELLAEELGDLTLQVVFLSELARHERAFGPDDVFRGLVEKLVRRHPHVFGDQHAKDSREVLQSWEAIKLEEKASRPLLAGVPRSLPALQRAQKVSAKVSRVGFDWPSPLGSRAKVDEELRELDEVIATGDRGRIEAELGDVFFALVNLARHAGVDAEAALRGTTERFTRRFSVVERRVVQEHGGWPKGTKGQSKEPIPLSELDGYWEEAKRLERTEPGDG